MLIKKISFTLCSLVLLVLVLGHGQLLNNADASVIPDGYDVVTLPYQPDVASFSAFTAINNNGLAIGYGTRNNRSIGFVFDFRKQEIVAIIDDILPMSINDTNKIAGIYVTPNGSITQGTCIINDAACEISSIEGAEFSIPIGPSSMTNSGFLALQQWVNTPEEQFLLYRRGELIYNALAGPDNNGVSQQHVDIQRNNTRLIVGNYKDSSGLETPFVKTLNRDLSISTLKLLAPGLDGGMGSGVAKAVNGLNQILISTANFSGESQLYMCEFVGDVDNDGMGDCENGLQFVGPSASSGFPFGRYPLNDRGLLVLPPSYNGGEIHLYDLTMDQPVAIPLSSKGFNASIFAKTNPMAVNNNQVILTSGAQTVLLVPTKEVPAISLQIHSESDPIVVAADGSDRLRFTETLTNNTNISQTLLYWRVLIMPDGTPYPRSTPRNFILDANSSVTENRARLRLPDYFPAGNYRYKLMSINVNNGEQFEDEVQIIKLPN